jgi:hypothetical protein
MSGGGIYISCEVWYDQNDNALAAHSMMVLGSNPLSTLVLYSSVGFRTVETASSALGREA